MKQTWIGFFTDKNDNTGYRWSDGSLVDYTNWASGEPNCGDSQKCAHITADPFVDEKAYFNYRYENYGYYTNARNYVCKKPAVTINLI